MTTRTLWAIIACAAWIVAVAKGQMDVCANFDRFDCLPDTATSSDKLANCPAICRKCPSQRVKRQCQTINRACLFSDKTVLPQHTTKAACEANAGTVWCGGDTIQQCVQLEPVRSLCYKLSGLTQCPGSHTTKLSCHLAGCFWCSTGYSANINKCFTLLPEAECGDTTCCAGATCIAGDVSEAACSEKGCNLCVDSNNVARCNHGKPATASCPSGFNEDCFVGSGVNPYKSLCDAMKCTWCRENGANVCRRTTFPATCNSPNNQPCQVSGLLSHAACKSHGCEWCGFDGANALCYKSTDATSCDDTMPVPCSGMTERACHVLGCRWCPNADMTYRCINVNTFGITRNNSFEWTECTRKCGGGTQFRYTNCGNPDPFLCPKEYRTCNNIPCVIPENFCSSGVRSRYNDHTICCQNHTFACGRNSVNDNSRKTSPAGRRKRVVGGTEVTDPNLWPWNVVVYTGTSNSATAEKCSATLIASKWAITTYLCVNGKIPAEALVHLATIDRSLAPGFESTVANFVTDQPLSVGLVELTASVPLDDTKFPICMPNGEEVRSDRKCVVIGFGRTTSENIGTCSVRLHEGDVRAMMWGLCQMAWGSQISGFDESKYMCAGIPEGGVDACTGDHGSALMCQRCVNCGWFLAGIGTTHLGCGAMAKPSVYIKTTGPVETWVNGIISNLDSTTYPSCNPQ